MWKEKQPWVAVVFTHERVALNKNSSNKDMFQAPVWIQSCCHTHSPDLLNITLKRNTSAKLILALLWFFISTGSLSLLTSLLLLLYRCSNTDVMGTPFRTLQNHPAVAPEDNTGLNQRQTRNMQGFRRIKNSKMEAWLALNDKTQSVLIQIQIKKTH